MAHTCSWNIIVLGVTGHLSLTKIIPSLYALYVKHPDIQFDICGVAYSDHSIQDILAKARPYIASCDDILWSLFIRCWSYKAADLSCPEHFASLNEHIGHKMYDQRLVYLATFSDLYASITRGLSMYNIIRKNNFTHKVAYEKPFGKSKHDSIVLYDYISQYVCDDQIYLIDHYLAKPALKHMLHERCHGSYVSQLYNQYTVNEIQISMLETSTVEHRVSFYEQYGALKDVIQNHMLQILSLALIDDPCVGLYADISRKKLRALSSLIVNDVVCGQYKGYKGCYADTFTALSLESHTSAGHIIPIYIRTGKALRQKSATLHFICTEQETGDKYIMKISISPEYSLSLFSVKDNHVVMHHVYKHHDMHDYEDILYGIYHDNCPARVTIDEVYQSWHVVDSAEKLCNILYPYEKGSYGPEKASILNNTYIDWLV
jgi:glucose-6-phosphate 1-dehydrogenase